VGASALIAACTLTSDEYAPPLVEPLAPLPLTPDAGKTEPCNAGESCCAQLPCPAGQQCAAGACVVVDESPGDAGGCIGTDCPGEPVPLAPSCTDGVQNGDETGDDCGGSCPDRCQSGGGCGSDADCGEGLFCAPSSSQCADSSCNDSVLNGTESAEDCGGDCPACADGVGCNTDADCISLVCGADGTCAAPTCADGARNGDEAGVDCGGSCPLACDDGTICSVNEDCLSQVCDEPGCGPGPVRCCQAPSCDDGVQNGTEPVTDCGNGACGLCPLGNPCIQNAQCQTGACLDGVCAPPPTPPTCTDGAQNGTESSVDCGGPDCPRCVDLRTCFQASDCNNNNCQNGLCISCGDTVRNGTETGIDCGGADPFCRRCNPGEQCFVNTDCISGFCFGGFCG
jgi:hypothetical protein